MLPEKDFNKLSLGTKLWNTGLLLWSSFSGAVGKVDSRTTALGSILGSGQFIRKLAVPFFVRAQ